MSVHNLTQLYTTDDAETASTWILVLSAVAIPHRINGDGASFTLLVSEQDTIRAEHEIGSYFNENKNWPPPPPEPDSFKPAFHFSALLCMVLLSLFYTNTGPWANHSLWFSLGSGNSTAILYDHELYRLVTPLFLHADIVHLTGNCVIGFFLLHFLFKITGSGIGFLAVLLTAISGNLVNVVLHGSGHNFVGFSTAVFSAIGILSSLQVRNLNKHGRKGLYQLLPFMAGLGLLAIFGSGGERTDLGAHFFGLISGCFGGLFLNDYIHEHRNSLPTQFVCFFLSIVIILLSWYLALY